MKKTTILNIVFLIVILIINIFVIKKLFLSANTRLKSIEVFQVTEEQLKNNVDSIAKRYSNKYAKSSLLKNSEAKIYLFKSHENSELEMSDAERIVFIDGGSPWFTRDFSNREIYGIFETHMYLSNKVTPYNLKGVAWHYCSGGIDNSNYSVSLITTEEFEKLRSNTDLLGLNNEEAAKKMADIWIKQVGYVKK